MGEWRSWEILGRIVESGGSSVVSMAIGDLGTELAQAVPKDLTSVKE